MILSPIVSEISETPKQYFEFIQKQVLDLGFIRFCDSKGNVYTINDSYESQDLNEQKIYIVIDRLIISDYSDSEHSDTKRLKDSLELAFKI